MRGSPMRWFRLTCIAVSVIYLASLSGHYILPSSHWPTTLLTPAFAYLFVMLSALFVVALFLRQTIPVILMLATCLAGWPAAADSWGMAASGKVAAKRPETLRVLQWNCQGLPGIASTEHQHTAERARAVARIRELDPHIICIQDFTDTEAPQVRSNLALLRDSLGFTYMSIDTQFIERQPWANAYISTLIVSRLPFDQTGYERYRNHRFPESIVWADLKWQGRTLRLVSTHFRSMHIGYPKGEPDPVSYFHMPDSAVVTSGNPLRKMIYFQQHHVAQARQLGAFIENSPYPVILGADLNTVPASRIYRLVKGKLTDGHRSGGLGLGGTYHLPLQSLRIDYLLYDPRLVAAQWRHIPTDFYDHDILLGDFGWQP